jgi:hypothetical protein
MELKSSNSNQFTPKIVCLNTQGASYAVLKCSFVFIIIINVYFILSRML